MYESLLDTVPMLKTLQVNTEDTEFSATISFAEFVFLVIREIKSCWRSRT